MEIVAIIPARGGSKGIPHKNIIDFAGRPLVYWSIKAAIKSKYINAVYVSTDDDKIAKVSAKSGAKVIKRPSRLAQDTSTSEVALKHAIREIRKDVKKIDYVVFLQATSPLRETKDIDMAIEQIIREKADSSLSVARLDAYFLWKMNGKKPVSINYNYKKRKRRQNYKGVLFNENGSIYVFKPDILMKHNNRFGGRMILFEMDLWKSFQIDSLEELKLCQDIFISRKLKI